MIKVSRYKNKTQFNVVVMLACPCMRHKSKSMMRLWYYQEAYVITLLEASEALIKHTGCKNLKVS